MLSPVIISKDKLAEPLNQEALYALGLEHVQRLSGRLWSDYNVHDPGVTTLELLCYALTDLSYRASYPMKDLLAEADASGKPFFTAAEILPCRPLTLLDFRKLLVDVAGVRNAWLRPAVVTCYADLIAGKLREDDPGQAGIQRVDLQGIYDVIIEFMDDIKSNEEKKQDVKDSVRRRLMENRNLCQDFAEIQAVEDQKFLLCAELELKPDADVANVQAEIEFQVQQYLTPPIPRYTLTQMLERKHADGSLFTVEEIFDGPLLQSGFIDDDEIAKADLRTEIRLSDLISIIMDIEGVVAVREIVINPDGTKEPLADKWMVAVAPGRKATLDRGGSRLVFYKRNMPVMAVAGEVETNFKKLVEAARPQALPAEARDLAVPAGKVRNLETYYSFQNHFPAIYGLSEQGLPSGADETRQAKALQLKAYLLFFDQLLANYFAQLRRAGDLLSADADLKRTYFAQAVNSFAEAEKLKTPQSLTDGWLKTLETALETPEQFIRRRNRFLDHLLARFAERFTDFAHVMYASFGPRAAAAMIPLKCEFLQGYDKTSSERGLGYNYSLTGDADLWDSANVPGLERRLAKLLGIQNWTRRNLGEISYEEYAEIDSTPGDEFRWRIFHHETGEIILSSSTHYATIALAKTEMQKALALAALPFGYDQQQATDGTFYFNIVDGTGEVVGRRIEYYATPELREQAIKDLMIYLQTHYSQEGMYLIEPLLLRPLAEDDPFLPISVDPNCTDCAEADPYSNRIHVILSAYAGRFADVNFRRFVEEVIREETPAHILPRICWVSIDQMMSLEKSYRDWLDLRFETDAPGRTGKLKQFIKDLFDARSVYPASRLRECDSENQEKFLVGQSAIGSMPEEPSAPASKPKKSSASASKSRKSRRSKP